ncbi:efflux transporter outer membrane subunit [Noviherbaspirillum soli]|uniref:efflux transporter outer membrane subunit n=1 Tax=Noviherbaspirillum soli TaxID=1064518 RepID=UPI00188AC94B|nr:efflux transporter outer membrane subunit [Noviherbaspirillum soli]
MNEGIACRASRISVLAALASTLALSACAVGPDYEAPAPPARMRYTPDDQRQITAGDAPAQQIRSDIAMPSSWWQAFGSAALDNLVASALEASPTVNSARATVEQARSLLDAARGAMYPVVEFTLSGQHSTMAASARGAAGNRYSGGPAISFLPDLSGGTRRRIESAQAQLAYQQAQWEAARLSLVANIVLQAIALASALEQIAAVRDIIAVDERNLELVRISTGAGKTAQLDVLTASSQLAADQTLLAPLLQQASIARHALAVLAGKTSGEWAPPEFDFSTLRLPDKLPLSLPSDLVRRRPDLRAAEALLHAANAAIGVAAAQLYPNITLNASWARTASSPAGLFGGASSVSVAADLLAPLFNGHALAAQRDAAIHAYAATLENYAQAVLQAFGQVADRLEALEQDGSLLATQGRALQVARATLSLTQQSYEAGQASLLQLLTAQRLYLESRLGMARASGQRYADTAQFFVAMGGERPTDARPEPMSTAPGWGR